MTEISERPKWKFYLLYERYSLGLGEGTNKQVIAISHRNNKKSAEWDFAIMGFDLKDDRYSIEEVSAYDDGTVMEAFCKLPDYLIE